VLDYRLHAQQVSSDSSDKQYAASLRVRRQMLLECGVDSTEEEVALHESVILERPMALADYLPKLANWFSRLESANAQSRYWDGTALHALLRSKFMEAACRTASDLRQLAAHTITGRYVSPQDIAIAAIQPQPKLLARIKRRVKTVLWRLGTHSRKS
jgi:hypothetical protein